ncbi:MAG: TonB-dependent receptor [Caulobacteraceae bacterium]|nr:TonB-dependent receptor [Caulobacteraceae bacterium]
MNKTIWLVSVSLATLGVCSAAFAETAPANSAATAAAEVSEIVVYGQGQTRQIETLLPKQIAQAAPGTSAIKVLQQLPGVNFESSDPFGAYEWATRISIRGFNQNYLGFTLDGVPLGDMSYGNDNGLHISRAISSENIGRTDLAQGTGALGTAASSNLGGTVLFSSRDPDSTFGALAEATYGSYSTNHEFLRIDSGEVPGGGRGYISYSNQYSSKWKGDGAQKQMQLNSKFVQPIGPVKLTGWFNYSDRAENDYQDLSLSMVQHFGYKLDNISNNWALAKQIAQAYQSGASTSGYPAPYNVNLAGSDPADYVYYNGSGLRKDGIGALKADWDITPDLTAHLMGYGHHNIGQGTWDTPYTPTPGGAPISIRTTEYDIRREGSVGSLEYQIAGHDIEAGFWYEHNHFIQARRYYGLNADGTNRDNLDFQRNPFYTQWVGNFVTNTEVFHLQDTWKVTEALKLNYGFKSMFVDVNGKQSVGTYASGDIKSNNGFLPQVGVNYNLGGGGEIFADYARNMKAFVGADTGGPFATFQDVFNNIKGKLKPETSDTFEGGYRYHNGVFSGVADAYYVKFDNRLLNVTVGSPIEGLVGELENVGSVTSYGFELAGTWRFVSHWSLTGSYAFNHSTYDDNVIEPSTSTVVATKGKFVVDTPEHIADVTLGYDDERLFGSVSLNYLSKRYFTYTNDQSVPAHTLVDLSIGYRFHGSPWLEGLEVQGNVTNLFNTKYIATVGTNGYTNSGDYQTLQAGAPTEAFITVRKKF